VLSVAAGRRALVEQYEAENDGRSDVTSHDASVKVNDTLDGAQAATMVLARKPETQGEREK
jgi:hypothetical protein